MKKPPVYYCPRMNSYMNDPTEVLHVFKGEYISNPGDKRYGCINYCGHSRCLWDTDKGYSCIAIKGKFTKVKDD